MDYNTESFRADLAELGIILPDDCIGQLLSYFETLVEWNSFMNLTAITDYDEVMKKHFIDSLSIIKAFDLENANSLIDVGTGAGFPGLVLKIVYPKLKVTLLDSLNKRIKFLNEVIGKLNLSGVETVHGRAEDFSKEGLLRESFDVCVSRAVANLSTLSEYCLPYVKVGGLFIPYKSEKSEEEIKAANGAVKVLGGEIEKQISFTLPNSDFYRNLIVIKKVNKTPAKYPRKAGLPSSEPLNFKKDL